MNRYSSFGNEDKSKFIHGIRDKFRNRHGQYKKSNSSIVSRVIRDGYDGQEFIIDGYDNTTFREACNEQWQFGIVKRNSKWFIKDERGNDITDDFLISYDGIGTLVPEYEYEIRGKDSDKSDEYSSIHDSVTYYD